MVHYKTMYCILCKGISDALDKIPDSAENTCGKMILQKSLLDAEEQFLSDTEPKKEQL